MENVHAPLHPAIPTISLLHGKQFSPFGVKKFLFSHIPSFAVAFSTYLKGSNDISFSVIISEYIF